MEETSKLLDRCARTTMQEFDWLNRPASEATEHLRDVLRRAEGALPSWMAPEFWTVEYQVIAQPSTDSVRVVSRGFALVPSCLTGKRISFYPQPPAVKAVLPDENLFVVGDNHLDALIGLARLVSAKLEITSGTTT